MFVRAEDRPDLTQDEFLVRDLVGLDCYLYDNDTDEEGGDTEVEGGDVCVGKVVGVVPPDELCR